MNDLLDPAVPIEGLPGENSAAHRRYNLFLVGVAGLGGLLYGIDVGIIGGALPYLEATSGLSAAELSVIVAAVLLGSVFSTLFAGIFADAMGRKPLMIVSGATFACSIPVIALSHGYQPLFWGRLLQGISAGLIGVVVPLYLAECLGASNRGKGTGVFQCLLTLGIVVAALVGIYYSYRVQAMTLAASPAAIFAFKDEAWRRIFWVSLPPGILFVLGSCFVTESPRWLCLRGRSDRALSALLRSRSRQQAQRELAEMQATLLAPRKQAAERPAGGSLLQRRYIAPFLLACMILFCNQTTGVNSIIAYNANILMQSGLSDLSAHWGYVLFTAVNFLVTVLAMILVDRKGRRFLLTLGTAGIVAATAAVGLLFLHSEHRSFDCQAQLQAMVKADQRLTLHFDPAMAKTLLASHSGSAGISPQRASLNVIYSYGDFTAATSYMRSDEPAAAPMRIARSGTLPSNAVEAFFRNPFGNLRAAEKAPLRIQKAMIGPIPSLRHGWLVAIGLYAFMAFYALGPGVVVWLALSELMPTRIRSNGMSIALVLNQLASTVLAGIFLPFVSRYGYSSIFFLFAAFTALYLAVVFLFLPETKGKTLEEIEACFDTQHAASP